MMGAYPWAHTGKSLELDLTKYKTIVFDCNGVVLDSNITKIDSYFRTAKKLGGSNEQAQALIDYHVKKAGFSRYTKFVWYLEKVLKQAATKEAVQEYLDTFRIAVSRGFMGCRLAEGLNELRQKTAHANWLIVSGTDQAQIRTLLSERDLAELFNGGIFGSPDNKDEILAREIENGNIQMPALFIGDCKYDYESSKRAGLDFIFLTDWTDDSDWKAYTKEQQIHTCRNIQSL